MFKFTAKNAEIIEKIKNGKRYEELAKEYNTSVSAIGHMVRKHELFKAYCDEIERLIGKNEINQETKLYELSKLLKFDTRSINALIAKNIKSVDKLLSLTEEEFYAIRNLGKVSQIHIKKCISEHEKKTGKKSNLCGVDDDSTKEIRKKLEVEELIVEKEVSEKVESIKANRDYIYKLIKAVDNRQIDSRYLPKEIIEEFGRIENINKELLKTLINLHKARNIPWEDEKRLYRVKMESKLEEILNMYE